MPFTNTAGPIALRVSLRRLMPLLRSGQLVGQTLVGQLRAAMRRQWDEQDNAVLASQQRGRFDSEVEDHIDCSEIARRDVELLVLRLDAAGLDGRACWRAICQEREPMDLSTPDTLEGAPCPASMSFASA